MDNLQLSISNPVETVSLDQLRPGESGTIVSVGGNGRCRRRYMEMGFVRGEKVIVERVAPLGDPIEYQIKRYHISLRREDAAQIIVNPCPPDCECDRPPLDACPNQSSQRGWRRWFSWLI